jgi:multiple sugar transport system ATP-binding protein
MGSSIHLHVSAVGKDVVVIVNTMDMTMAEVAALKSGTPIKFTFGGHNCHMFNKETGFNLEA